MNKLNKSHIGNVVTVGDDLTAHDHLGNDYTKLIWLNTRKNALQNGNALMVVERSNGSLSWKQVSMSQYTDTAPPVVDPASELPTEQIEMMNFIHQSYNLKLYHYNIQYYNLH